MQEDKRVKKTKMLLKQTLISLLSEKPFEKLTVKEICERSETSRITFYTHYNDKFDLMDTVLDDMVNIATVDYHEMQRKNNTAGDAIQSYCNMLDCILNLYYNHFDFFSHSQPQENPYIYAAFYQYVMQYVIHRVEKESRALQPRYSPSATSAFITNGIWGFISASHAAKEPIEKVRADAKELLKSLLVSDSITKANSKQNF